MKAGNTLKRPRRFTAGLLPLRFRDSDAAINLSYTVFNRLNEIENFIIFLFREVIAFDQLLIQMVILLKAIIGN